MILWDESAKSRLTMFALGLGCGCLLLLLPPKVETVKEVQIQVVEKRQIETQEVIKYRDRWRDRTVVIEKPDGSKTTIVDHSGETSGEKTDTSKKTEEKVVTKIERIVEYARARYAVGANVSFTGKVSADVGVRLGSLPVFLTAGVGALDLKTKGFDPVYTLGVRIEL